MTRVLSPSARETLGIHTHLIDKIAVANGIFSGLALYPQIYDVLFRGGFTNFSSLSLVLILCNSIVWILYSIHRRLISLFIASVLNFIAVVILLAL